MRNRKPFDMSQMPQNVAEGMADESFKVYCKAPDDEAGDVELLVMEEIGENAWTGEGVAAKNVVSFLAENRGRDVNVRVNSPGGLVYDGFQIYNALASHDAPVTVTIEGLAYSAASVIAMAGDHVRAYETSDYGIHRAMSGTYGNAIEMRAVAEWLDKLDDHAIDIYQEATGASREQITNWIDGSTNGQFGTIFSATEAHEAGFVDEVIKPKKGKKNEARIQAASKRMLAENRLKLNKAIRSRAA